MSEERVPTATELEAFEAEIKQFVADRDAAFLSMDKATLLAFSNKWGADLHNAPNEETFWAAIHMARTGAKSLPMDARITSKRWLTERNLRSIDDGDIPDLSL